MSAMTMRDKIARAINKAGIDWLEQNDPKRMTLSWADVPDEVFADAALSAMREPSEAMRHVVRFHYGAVQEVYVPMIDTAIQEKGE